MEQLQTTLRDILESDFHVIQSQTQRVDQWYKRRNYSGGVTQHPLILTPRQPVEEWTPKVHRFATAFCEKVERIASERLSRRNQATAAGPNKVFPDSALDESRTNILSSAMLEEGALTPAMQRLSFWTRPSPASTYYMDHPDSHVNAIKALLFCGQQDPLLYLATEREAQIRDRASMRNGKKKRRTHIPDKIIELGWQGIIGEVLEVMLFFSILGSFPDILMKDDAYKTWAPFDYHFYSTEVGRVATRQVRPGADFGTIIDQCFQVLCRARELSIACGAPYTELQGKLEDTFLHYLGFEAWNRDREGHGYLECQLNVTKGESWLRSRAEGRGEDDEDEPAEDHQSRSRSASARPRDPLHLRGPKEEPEVELSDSEVEQMQRLGVLEAKETLYGLKRSTKYQRNRVDD